MNAKPAETFHDHVKDDSPCIRAVATVATAVESKDAKIARALRATDSSWRRSVFTRSPNDALDGRYTGNPSAHDIASVLHLIYNRPE